MTLPTSRARRRWRNAAIAVVSTFGLTEEVARASEVVPLPVVRVGVGAESRVTTDVGLVGAMELGTHLHYRLLFFGGELGVSMVEDDGGANATFVTLGVPVGVTTTEALAGFAFTPRVMFGDRFQQSIVALRLGGTLYALGGVLSLELGYERWFGEAGSAHLVGVLGMDAGRAIYLLLDGGDLNEIQ